ncbi:MAG TPA: hypothetical protein VF198_03650 [Vicinamibacterales bacterium]
MTRVLVNSQARDLEPGLKTLGDLLAWADRTSASAGEVVTAVRLDGVEEPSFRDAAFAARTLDDFAVVEMEVATPATLVATSLDEALRGLAGLRQHTLEIAQRFRRADAVYANEGLAELTGGLRTLVSLLDALGTAMGVPLEAAECDGQTAIEVLEGLGTPLAALSEAQAQQDWVTVADILEFDLEPALGRCEPFFSALAALARRAADAH